MGLYPYGLYGFRLDPTYILVIIGAVICMIASASMNSTFNKYEKVRSRAGMTGAQLAERMLRQNGIYDVTVNPVSGRLSDHYDPRRKTVSLSESVYNSTSIAALGVAAHECGHAIQHDKQYFPLTFRSAFVPVANLGSTLAWPFILIGLFIQSSFGTMLINIGILAFSMAVLFQLITLPVEFNASKRAIRFLEDSGYIPSDEITGARRVLTAAALTYVASAAAILLQLLRLIVLRNNRR